MKDLFFAFLGIVFIAGCIIIFLNKEAPISDTERVVRIGETRIVTEVSDTFETRARGLSGRVGLEEGRGMLFVFDTPGKYGFWMRDMNFSIDIIYISDVGVVRDIKHNLSPETYPEIFYSNEPIKYALEVPAGFALKNGIDIGAKVSFE